MLASSARALSPKKSFVLGRKAWAGSFSLFSAQRFIRSGYRLFVFSILAGREKGDENLFGPTHSFFLARAQFSDTTTDRIWRFICVNSEGE
jgi:hypothetical protein